MINGVARQYNARPIGPRQKRSSARQHSMVFRIAIVAVLLTELTCASNCGAANDGAHVVPLQNAHAHNDYLHARPLLDALDHGFTSVEADVFLVDGALLVGHESSALKPERTLETLYLAPLAERVKKNGGHVYPVASRFFLLIDIKAAPQPVYQNLKTLLARYNQMLTVVADGKVRPGAVMVVLTGARPRIDFADSRPRYVALDGRLSELESRVPPDQMPMVSDNWSNHFKWSGTGPMPESERVKLDKITSKAHAAGRVVRFWNTSESENLWRELRAAGVDLINTDELNRLASFLKSIQ